MNSSILGLPESVVDRLFLIERPLLVDRYRVALSRIADGSFDLERFHVDAVGYSPQIAAGLGDPYYLGHGISHPAFVILSVDQLRAPLLQPNVGYAGLAFQRWSSRLRSEIADLTLSEPIFGELSHGLSRFQHPAQLGLVRELRLEVSTPSGRLAHAVRLGEMQDQLLQVDPSWRDEDFLAQMTYHAKEARGWVEVVPDLVTGRRLPVEPSFLPDFGGTYVWPGSGDDGPLAWVLCDPEWISGDGGSTDLSDYEGVCLIPRTAEGLGDFLVERGLVEARPTRSCIGDSELDALRMDVARDYLRGAGFEDEGDAADPLRAMRSVAEPPADFMELEDVALRLRSRPGPLDLSKYSARTRLRLMPVVTEDDRARWWIGHLRAFLDPLLLPRVERELGGLLPGLYPARDSEVAS